MNISKAVQSLKTIVPLINSKYRAYADQIVDLFKQRKIEKTKEAENLLLQLGGRGKAPRINAGESRVNFPSFLPADALTSAA